MMKDVYFDENYGKLYEKAENGEAIVFKCETSNGTVINQFIKRKIPIDISGDHYDIVTPYGYGGPYIEKCVNREALLKDYEEEFGNYCRNNGIVAEFVRFHPIYKNYEDFTGIYNCSFNRYTLATNIKDYDDPVQSEFSKSAKKTAKTVLKKGVSFKLIDKPTVTDMEEFKRIYYLNMKRKDAEEFYYFDDQYFNDIMKYFDGKYVIAESVYDGKVIAAGLYFTTANMIHAHLSGTDTDYLSLSPAYLLKYGTAIWAKENGYDLIHYGGGTSTSLENPLYLFKKKFAQNTQFEFWIGKKIWDETTYDSLCKAANVGEDEEFFPAYRKVQL